MSTYRAPKRRLHREFLYLNHDTVLNSLSALEAGKVDEIIQKVNEAKEGGMDVSAGVGPVRGGGKKTKGSTVQEELVRTRTWFSAYDAWYRYLSNEGAIGSFDTWSEDVRGELAVGDTLEFAADLVLSPIHKLLRTFISYSENAGTFGTTGKELAEVKKTAAMMVGWLGGSSKKTNLPMYLQPSGVAEPRIIAALHDDYVIGDREGIEGTYTVVGQVSRLLTGSDVVSTIRVIRDVPPTPLEVNTINEAMTNFIEPARELGVDIGPSDINISAPAVILRPIAIYQ